jgi:hypothetical protein
MSEPEIVLTQERCIPACKLILDGIKSDEERAS